MTRQEFERLTGLQVTDEYYERINKAYMALPQDKDMFCKQWVEDKEYLLLQLAERVYDEHGKRSEIWGKARQLAEGIIRLDMPDSCGSAYDTAYEVLGERGAIVYKVENDIPLSVKDKEYIKNAL